MKSYFFASDFTNDPTSNVNIDEWSCIIPAAGRGSRLGYSLPKILYPVAGKTILERLIESVRHHVSEMIIVVSPQGERHVIDAIHAYVSGMNVKVTIQHEPMGMADAVHIGLAQNTKRHTLVIWGDQVILDTEIIPCVQKAHLDSAGRSFTLPLYRRADPYVHYVMDAEHKLVNVLQRREGDRMPEIGLSDVGMFAFDAQRLSGILADTKHDDGVRGRVTGEWNLLQVLPYLERMNGDSAALLSCDGFQVYGINTVSDAAEVEKVVQTMQATNVL